MIGAGYHGPLYAEISPKTFPVLAARGDRGSHRCAFAPATPFSIQTNSMRCMIWNELVDCDDADLVNGVGAERRPFPARTPADSSAIAPSAIPA